MEFIVGLKNPVMRLDQFKSPALYLLLKKSQFYGKKHNLKYFYLMTKLQKKFQPLAEADYSTSNVA